MKRYKIIMGLTTLILGCLLIPSHVVAQKGQVIGTSQKYVFPAVGVNPAAFKPIPFRLRSNNGWLPSYNNGWLPSYNNGWVNRWNNGWNYNNNWNWNNGWNNNNWNWNYGLNNRFNRCDRFDNSLQGPVAVSSGGGYGGGYGDYPPGYRLNYATNSPADYDMSSDYRVPGAMSQAPVYEDIVVTVQRELRRRGFYRGVVNGLSDAPTRAAVRSFETSMGLPVTGIIGMPLLRALGGSR